MTKNLNINVEVVDKPINAVLGCDIVVTAGPISKKPSPVIENSWFKEGAFASAVDFDSYWKPEVFHKCDMFSTDDISQMLYYRKSGYFSNIPDERNIIDLGNIVSGKSPKRTSEKSFQLNL